MEHHRQQQQQQRTTTTHDPTAMTPGTEFISFVTQALGVLLEVVAHVLFLALNLAWALVNSFVEAVLPTRKTFQGQAALVVSAGGGVGREVALLLGKRGARVICWDTDTPAVRETVRLIKAGGGEAYHYTVDVTKRSEVDVAAHIARVDVQEITLLVNPGAAASLEAPLLDVHGDDAEAFLERTLLTHVRLLQALMPHMVHAGAGHVVTLLPAEGVRGAEGAALTGAHGGGIRSLTEALRADVTALGRKADISFTNVYALHVRPDAVASTPDEKTRSVTPKEAAKAMLEAAESNFKEVSLPGTLLPVANLARLLPQPVIDVAKDVIFPPPEKPPGTRVHPPRRRYVSEVEHLYSR